MKIKKYIFSFVFILVSFVMYAQPDNCIDTTTVIVCEGPIIHEQDTVGVFGPHPPHNNPDPEEPLAPKEKVVFWLHGLGGSEITWVSASSWTSNNYKARTINLDYSALEDADIDAAANTIRSEDMEVINQNQINQDESYTRDKSILITHSQGGVVARQIESDILTQGKQREYGALATFGGPHYGAEIIASVKNGFVQEYLSNTCHVLAKPLANEKIKNTSISLGLPFDFLDNTINKKFIEKLKEFYDNSLEDFVCDEIIDKGFGFLKESISPHIGNDLLPNEPDGLIHELLQIEVEVPSVAFYGIEDEPVSLREIYSLNAGINYPMEDKHNPHTPESNTFTADYDYWYVKKSNELALQFLSKYQWYKGQSGYQPTGKIFTLADALGCKFRGGIINGGECWEWFDAEELEQTDTELAGYFNDAYQWINDFNTNYKILFGLGKLKNVTHYELKCVCHFVNDPDITTTYNDLCQHLPPDITGDPHFVCEDQYVPYQVTQFVNEESDGVVPMSSANHFPVKNGVYFDSDDLPGSNHQQMRNDHNTGIVLPALFNGTGEHDLKFKLEPK